MTVREFLVRLSDTAELLFKFDKGSDLYSRDKARILLGNDEFLDAKVKKVTYNISQDCFDIYVNYSYSDIYDEYEYEIKLNDNADINKVLRLFDKADIDYEQYDIPDYFLVNEDALDLLDSKKIKYGFA